MAIIASPENRVTPVAMAGRARGTFGAAVPTLVCTTAQLPECTRPSSVIWAASGQGAPRLMNCGRRATNSSRGQRATREAVPPRPDPRRHRLRTHPGPLLASTAAEPGHHRSPASPAW